MTLPKFTKILALHILLFYCISPTKANQPKKPDSDSVTRSGKVTPFHPWGNYQTLAFRLRLLPWIIGDNKGYNALAGFQFGFLKNHSLSADVMKAYSGNNIDAFYRNDSLVRPNRNRNVSTVEFHFAYNYHFNFELVRENSGLSFYAGIHYRIGNQQMASDTGMFMNDHTIKAERKYYGIGPQFGIIYNIGKSKHFALNLNITPLYLTKNITTTEQLENISFTHTSTFKTYDLRVGLNLILWIKYCKVKA